MPTCRNEIEKSSSPNDESEPEYGKAGREYLDKVEGQVVVTREFLRILKSSLNTADKYGVQKSLRSRVFKRDAGLFSSCSRVGVSSELNVGESSVIAVCGVESTDEDAEEKEIIAKIVALRLRKSRKDTSDQGLEDGVNVVESLTHALEVEMTVAAVLHQTSYPISDDKAAQPANVVLFDGYASSTAEEKRNSYDVTRRTKVTYLSLAHRKIEMRKRRGKSRELETKHLLSQLLWEDKINSNETQCRRQCRRKLSYSYVI